MTKKPKPGAAFERLAAAVQHRLAPGAIVEWDEELNGRQIDVSVRGKLGSAEILVIVECRDYGEKLGIKHVDGLDSVAKEVKANKAILVTRTGFTEPALKKAAEVGIETCVLREAVGADWPGPHKPLRRINLTIHLLSTLVEDVEVNVGEDRWIPASAMDRIREDDGNTVFFQDLVTSYLQLHPERTVAEGELLRLSFTPAPVLLRDADEPRVQGIRCRVRTGRLENFVKHTLWQAPAEWVFVKHLPRGEVSEPEFFRFEDLEKRAAEFKARTEQLAK